MTTGHTATPRTDALTARWNDDGASRGPAYVEMRDLAREMELGALELKSALKVIATIARPQMCMDGTAIVGAKDAISYDFQMIARKALKSSGAA